MPVILWLCSHKKRKEKTAPEVVSVKAGWCVNGHGLFFSHILSLKVTFQLLQRAGQANVRPTEAFHRHSDFKKHNNILPHNTDAPAAGFSQTSFHVSQV